MSEPILEQSGDRVRLSPRGGAWELSLDARRGAALDTLIVGGTAVAGSSAFRADDCTDQAGVPGKCREFRKTGAAVVSGGTVLPFGAEIAVARTWRVAANHARVTADVKWPRGTPVQRHVGLDGLWLPGHWQSFRCLPPLQHLMVGELPFDREIPPFGGERRMIGHWHRPPLALVFRNENGLELEVGTGDDIWRWEQSLGYGPESGSYKIFVCDGGLEVIREPLMCCAEYTPAAKQYRFTWHLAWMPAEEQNLPPGSAAPPSAHVVDWDLSHTAWPEAACRSDEAAEGVASDHPCFASPASQKVFRRWVRQVGEANRSGELVLRGVGPGPCQAATHVHRGSRSARLPHWDLHALLALGEWTRQRLGEEWIITAHSAGIAASLPSVRGLFLPNGFDSARTTDSIPGE